MSRRTRATLLFTDIVGSTELLGRLGDDDANAVTNHHFEVLRTCIAGHGGREVKNLGDGLMVVFPEALAAAACAVEMQQQVAAATVDEIAVSLGLRVGVHHGDVLISDEASEDYFGTTVVVAKRLCDRAERGEILISTETWTMVDESLARPLVDRGGLALKGIADPVHTGSLIWDDDRPVPADASSGDEADAPGSPESGIPMPLFVQSELRTPFAGRQRELQRLVDLLDEASDDGCRVVLLGGEPGIGKTRLTCELARIANGRGARVLFGRSDEEGLLPYQPFVEALGQAVAHLPEAERDAVRSAPWARHLERLVPELALTPGDQGEADRDTDRHLLFTAVAELLAALGSTTPTVLVLDDLHWADAATVLLLKHVARLQDVRLLVVGTYRDIESPVEGPLIQAIAQMRREKVVELLSLAGLDREGISRLIASWAGQPAPPGFVDAVFGETEGQPLFTQEVLRHLLESNALYDGAGRLVSRLPIQEIGVPEGVRAVVERRIARLDDATRKALSVAAVVGREFSTDLVARTMDADEDDVLDHTERAVAAGVVVEVPGALSRFRFSHALFRQALYDDLSATRRARLHERIAVALEGLTEGALALPELAHHFFLAASSSDVLQKAIGYALAAADRAEGQLAFEEAAVQLDRAVRGLDLQGPGSPDLCRALLRLGTNRWRAGEYTPARETFQRAASLAGSLGQAELLAEGALGYAGQIGFEYGTANPTAVAFLEQALDALGSARPDLRALVQSRLGESLVATGDRDRAGELVRGAIAQARALGDPAVLGTVLSHSMLPIAGPGDPYERLAMAEEAVALGLQTEDAGSEITARFMRAATLLELGDIPSVLEEVEEVHNLAAVRPEPYFQWMARLADSSVELGVGRVASAEAAAWAALTAGQQTQNASATQLFAVQMMHIRQYQSRLAEIRISTRNMTDHFERIPALRAGLAMLLSEIGWTDEAQVELDKLALHDFGHVPQDVFWLVALYLSAEAAVRLEDRKACRVLLGLLEPYAGRVVVGGFTAAPLGFVDRALGMLEAVVGDPEVAEAHLRTAVGLSQEAGFLVAVTIAQVDLARVVRERGADAEAAELIEAARTMATELGVQCVLDRLAVLEGTEAQAAERPRTRRLRAILSTRGRSALARLVGDATDDELERRFGTPMAQRALFSTLASSFQPALAFGFQGDIMIELTHPASGEIRAPEQWTITIEGNKATSRHRASPAPELAIRATAADFIRIVSGVKNAVEAWLSGALVAEGNVLVAGQLVDMFGGGEDSDSRASEVSA